MPARLRAGMLEVALAIGALIGVACKSSPSCCRESCGRVKGWRQKQLQGCPNPSVPQGDRARPSMR